ncbi:hypothetical protein AU210_007077 [Fusarium oxysporum f. sp. radicis-cucumerinum]|uniref:CDP-diacylglycerol--serine O-phosphatidyltransferase n=1 Tax=Fusarium oxysporum f. sp. radicis-cucumerinum TaxID=327505 RepID=A0A2H3H7B4_FUSOX|nr:hypothetical protein AU210_007077 [Fusarium oxysporum f. sp. radicis-cucumerinum]
MATNVPMKYDMLRRLRVADYITLSNGFCGVLAIFCAIQKSLLAAHLLIFLGYEFDRFDGIVARARNECSEMGKQLDSFCDLVSFCVAPAVMIYCAGFDTVVDQLALALFVCSGVARLSRFNIAAHLVPKSDQGKAMYHEGLPTAYAALLISTAVAVAEWTSYLTNLASGSHYPVIIVVLIFSAAMVSKRLHLYIDGAYSIPAVSMLVFAGCWSHSPMPIRTVLW